MIGAVLGFVLTRSAWLGALIVLSMFDPTQASVNPAWLLLVSLVIPSSAAALAFDAMKSLRRPRVFDERGSPRRRFYYGMIVGVAAAIVSILLSVPLIARSDWNGPYMQIELFASMLSAACVMCALRRPARERCFWCGYDHRGFAVCPECGHAPADHPPTPAIHALPRRLARDQVTAPDPQHPASTYLTPGWSGPRSVQDQTNAASEASARALPPLRDRHATA